MEKKLNSKQRKAAEKAKKVATAPVASVEVVESAPVAKVTKGGLPKLPALPKASRSRKPKPFVKCACGCDGDTRSMWVPGHDARARGWAIRIERDICKMSAVPVNEQPGAKYFLKLRKETGVASEGGNGIKLVKGKKGEPEAATEPATAGEAVNQ